jgi:hypothetical protein
MEKRPLRSPAKNQTRVLCTRLAGLAIRSDTWSAALHLRHALPPQFRNASLRLLRRQFPQAGLRRGGQCDRAQCCQRVHRRDRKAHTERDRQTPSQNAPCKPVHDPTTIYPRYYSSHACTAVWRTISCPLALPALLRRTPSAVAVMYEKSRLAIPRAAFNNLPCRPLGGWIRSDLHVRNLPARLRLAPERLRSERPHRAQGLPR